MHASASERVLVNYHALGPCSSLQDETLGGLAPRTAVHGKHVAFVCCTLFLSTFSLHSSPSNPSLNNQPAKVYRQNFADFLGILF